VPFDTHQRNGNGGSALDAGAPRAADPVAAERGVRKGFGLPVKLLFLTAVFVMLAEVLIFVPSIANFRVNWLTDRLTAARIAALAASAGPDGVVPPEVRSELLNTAQLKSVAIKTKGTRRQVLPAESELTIDAAYDLRPGSGQGFMDQIGLRAGLIADAIAAFLAPAGRTILVRGHPISGPGTGLGAADFVEIVLPEAPLKAAMVRFGLNILGLSIIISVIAAALVYFALSSLLVQPMMRLTRSMLRFSQHPEDANHIIVPSQRADEIGVAERELAHMQQELAQTLHQKNRLAQLGLAVSKINHDLRNMLASAQLLSDRLGAVPDPTVQRFAPKLIASLDRAISFCNDTLRFGRVEESSPRRELLLASALVEDLAEGLGLPREGLAFRIDIDPGLRIDADPEHLFRVLNNLCRNAVQAIEGLGADAKGEITVKAWREGRWTMMEVRDTGPGVPAQVRANLFKPFRGGARPGGTGLGLAIAAELVAAHGGTLRALEQPSGSTFRLEIPDRGTSPA
jgi:signal transduction histidine kinase